MANVRNFWCNRILYYPQSIGNKPPHMATYFPVLLWFRKERYRAWNSSCLFFPVAAAGKGACRLGRKPDTCTVMQWQVLVLDQLTTSWFFLHFVSLILRCRTLIYYKVITATFRLQCKSRSLWITRLRNRGPGSSQLRVPETDVKGCHQLSLQSFTHKSCLSQTSVVCFFSTHHTILKSLLFLCHLNSTRNRSGATHVRSIFTVYVGILSALGDGYWVMGVHCLSINTD